MEKQDSWLCPAHRHTGYLEGSREGKAPGSEAGMGETDGLV